jgi:hypothetical protein
MAPMKDKHLNNQIKKLQVMKKNTTLFFRICQFAVFSRSKSNVKTTISICSTEEQFARTPARRIVRPFLILLVLGSLFCGGCFNHYYQTNSTDRVNAANIQQMMKANKYFILHANHRDFSLKNIKVNEDNLEGDVDTIAEEHAKHLNPKSEKGNRFKAKDGDVVLYEVHLYTLNPIESKSRVILRFTDIKQIDVYGLDKTATSRSTALSIVGASLVTAGVIGIIVASSADQSHAQSTTTTANSGNISCSPQVYVFNQEQKQLSGTLFSGAIYASLERTDYLPLPELSPHQDKLPIQIKGEKNEELFFNEIKLLQVTHPSREKVLLDRRGKVLACQHPVSPYKVSIGGKENIKKDILVPDGKYYSFTNHSDDGNTSDIILDFKKPRGTLSGKLVISAKNSGWSYFLFRKFKSLYGDSYSSLIQRKDKAKTAQVLQCELDQSLPLLVSVKEGNNWKFADYFLTPGNTLPRDMIMELNLANLKGQDHVQIRIQTSFMFWDLDYAGMDFSENNFMTSAFLSPSAVKRSDSAGKLYELDQIDNKYIAITDKEQLNIEFALDTASTPGQQHSYFLVGSGYYHDNTQYPGKAHLKELNTFSGKGAFDNFSRIQFEELLSLLKNNTAKDMTTSN